MKCDNEDLNFDENLENINHLNVGNTLINKLNSSSYGADHELNINTIQMR